MALGDGPPVRGLPGQPPGTYSPNSPLDDASAEYKRAAPGIYSRAARRTCARSGGKDESAQAEDVVGNGANFRIAHLRRDGLHHLVRIVVTVAGAERLQLRLDILGILPRQAWILRGQAGAGRAVASRARGKTLRQIAAAPDLAAQLHGFRSPRRAGLRHLSREIRGDVANIGVRKTGCHSTHHGVVALRLFSAGGLEVAQLLLDVLGYLAGELGVGRRRAVAVGAVTRRADSVGDALPLRGVGLGVGLRAGKRSGAHH